MPLHLQGSSSVSLLLHWDRRLLWWWKSCHFSYHDNSRKTRSARLFPSLVRWWVVPYYTNSTLNLIDFSEQQFRRGFIYGTQGILTSEERGNTRFGNCLCKSDNEKSYRVGMRRPCGSIDMHHIVPECIMKRPYCINRFCNGYSSRIRLLPLPPCIMDGSIRHNL